MLSTRNTLIVAAVAILAGGTTVAIGDSDLLRSDVPDGSNPTTRAASPAALATFSALTDPGAQRRGGERLAAQDEKSGNGARIVADLGVKRSDLALARSVSSGDFLLAPGSGGICTVRLGRHDASSGCASEREAATGQAFRVSGCLQSGDLTVYGPVPNGVRSVSLAPTKGDPVEAPVTNNMVAYVIQSDTPESAVPQTIRWQGLGTPVSASLPMPHDPTC
jgi:hypothetical protein